MDNSIAAVTRHLGFPLPKKEGEKSYTVFYNNVNGVEQKLNIKSDNSFHAKYLAFTQHSIPLKSIIRVL